MVSPGSTWSRALVTARPCGGSGPSRAFIALFCLLRPLARRYPAARNALSHPAVGSRRSTVLTSLMDMAIRI